MLPDGLKSYFCIKMQIDFLLSIHVQMKIIQ